MPRFSFLLPSLFLLGTLSLEARTDKVSPDLERYMEGRSSEMIRALVVLGDRVDTRAIGQVSPYRSVRHEMVVNALRDKARQTQAGLLGFLEAEKQKATVLRYRSFWITNLVAIEAQADVINRIAGRPEVETIYFDYPVEMIEPVAPSASPVESPGAAEPGLRDIHANKLWDIGITGEGVIVMNLDTGVDGAHPALAARWRGLEPGVDPSWAWYNADNPNQTFPVDFGYHGTHTMGTLTGLAPGTADTIGVAFGAHWIAAAWDYTTLNKFISDVIAEFNWAADPDGDPQTTDDVPAVISNSWGVGTLFGQPPCDASFFEAIDNAEAAGAAVVFAAGNEGPNAGSLRAPAERNTTTTNCFSVGALNPGSTTIATFSSRGPSDCVDPPDRIKPEVCARGVTVRSSYPGGSYITLDGTSMACPHVAGGLALLRDAFPNATVDDLKNALMSTAVDLGTVGEDNTYGHGLIDLWAAYNELLGSGGGIPCEDIVFFNARCNGSGTAQAMVKLTGDYGGQMVTFELDGTPHDVTLMTNGVKSIGRLNVGGAGVGAHTIELVEPAGCYGPVGVNCQVDTPPDPEWIAVLQEYEAMEQEARADMRTSTFDVMGNYPNPFNPTTTISYALNTEGFVTLRIYNTLGEEVATLVNEYQTAGYKSVTWNGRNGAGAQVASGIYMYRLTAGGQTRSDKMMFMK